jgi:soluble lytic murein transglycosylase-like protein
MQTPHIPNLGDIKSANEEIRFYALAGAIMSLAAGLELTYFDVFERATKINRELAASFFYKIWSASTRRDIADAAVQRALDGNPMLSEWSALYQRITTLTGKSSQRHLLAHAVIRQEVIAKQGPISSSGFLGLMETAISYRVEQDAALLLAGQREARTADFDSLFAYCEEIISVLSDLHAFVAKLP